MTMMTGKGALIELLRNEGVEYVFGIPGATEIVFMDALEKCQDIKYILGLNEIVCAGMAEGYARTSGKPGFLNLHTGPGVAASMSMLFNAYKGGVPLVITAGQQDTRLLLQDPHLSGDLVGMARHFTKWSAEVLHASDIPVVIQRAFKMAQQNPTGPVFISLPQDVLNQTLDFEYVPGTPCFTKLRPDREAINKAADILLETKTPAIVVESGVAKNDALSEVVKLAELIGARVYQPWMADVNFPVNHPQYLGDLDPAHPKTREILQPVDVLIGVGCPLFSQAMYLPEPVIAKHTRVIQIDDDPREIGKNFPVTCGIQGHIKVSLAELIATLQRRMSTEVKEAAKARVERIAREKAAITAAFLKQAAAEKDNVPISVSRLMQDLKDVVTAGTIIVDDCWSSSGILRRTLDFQEPCSFLRARGGGSIGWGLPGALGAKLGAPDRPVVAVSGDGSAAWSMQSLWTAAHYNIPVTFIITANANYRQVKIMRRNILGGELNWRHEGMELDEPVIDFCQLAQAMGVPGEKVDRPEKLKKALRSALASGKPRLVEVCIVNAPTI